MTRHARSFPVDTGHGRISGKKRKGIHAWSSSAGNTMELASHEMKWMQEGGGSAGSHTSRVRHHDHRTSPLRRHRRDLLPPAGHGTRTGLFFFFETTYGPSGAKAGEDRHRGPSLAPGGGRFPLMHTCKFVGCECVVVGLVPLGPN